MISPTLSTKPSQKTNMQPSAVLESDAKIDDAEVIPYDQTTQLIVIYRETKFWSTTEESSKLIDSLECWLTPSKITEGM